MSALLPVSPAADAVAATGNLCSFTSDPTAIASDQATVYMRGGPLGIAGTPTHDLPWPDDGPRVLAELPVDGLDDPVAVTMTCSVSSGRTHADPVIASASATGTTAVAFVSPPR